MILEAIKTKNISIKNCLIILSLMIYPVLLFLEYNQLQIISYTGLLSFVIIAYIFSSNKSAIPWKTVSTGIVLQLLLAIITLKSPLGIIVFNKINNVFSYIIQYTNEGTKFVFGNFFNVEKFGFSFALNVLPVIVVMGGLLSVFYHVGIMNKIMNLVSKIMMKVLGTSGSESMACIANMFFGPTESSLVVKPYIKNMTKSELMTLLIGGLSSVAGSVLIAFIGIGVDTKHLLTAVLLSSISALVVSKILEPETEKSETLGECKVENEKNANSVIDAFTNGLLDGFKLAMTIGALLLGFIAAIAILNGLLGYLGSLVGLNISFEIIMAYIFAPIAFLQGIPIEDVMIAGSLLGKKLVANEFVAYLDLMKNIETLSPRTVNILTYSLCGFTNMSAYSILLGGIKEIAPEQAKKVSKGSIIAKALLGGTLACLMTGCLAGMLL